MPKLIYLACPYSDADPLVEDARYHLVTKVTAALIIHTECEVFSPITHARLIKIGWQTDMPLKKVLLGCLPTDFWLGFDYHMLDVADWLYVLCLDGWEKSKGVLLEIERFTVRKSADSIRYTKWEEWV